MDGNLILLEQQKDFCHRLRADYLFTCQLNNYYTEIDVIKTHQITTLVDKLTSASQQKVNISENKNIIAQNFLHGLGEKFIQKHYGDLFTVDKTSQKDVFIDTFFTLNNSYDLKILARTILKNDDDIFWSLTEEQVNQYDVFIFLLSIYNFHDDIKDYPIILGGFLTQDYLKKNIDIQKILISDLFYGGGLKGYLSSRQNDQVSGYIQQANKHFQKKDFDLAIDVYNQGLQLEDKNPQLYFLKGVSCWKKGDYQGAIKDFSRAIDLDKNYLLPYQWRGFAYTYFQKYDLALQDYEEEIKIDSVSFWGYYKRAFIHAKLGNYLQALDDYSICLTINPKCFYAYCNRGFVYFQLKDYHDAIEDYNRVLSLNPSLFEVYYNLGCIYQILGNHSQCISCYKESLKINPRYEKPYFNLAILQADLGQFPKAIALYDKILTLNPNFIQAEYNRDALVLLCENEGKLLGEYTEYNQQKNSKTPYLVDVHTYHSLLKKRKTDK
ncbi:Tetratricopeptide TPR_1 repeat-containing protein [Cyanobacterium stanieri PCC 7202]|uniref:Tetratricopeptide TPR_1 repeat-containing protein n=1 Tax=Cyanobacterium stanieri (strain ATCC 29140 / PCC 7202) TaxID=292563 RepID=K9YIU8_CYASC|nr:Tetratricopeptide TPR_1 repeat-containing protein [Cyanobacterium stanieri PCC 7202]